jgi:hypothetical protein
MLYGIAFITCAKLIDRYPDGYLPEDLFEVVREAQPALSSFHMFMNSILDDNGGKASKWSMIPCWIIKDDGLIYFDPDAQKPNPRWITVDFKTMYAKKLADMAEKEHEGD